MRREDEIVATAGYSGTPLAKKLGFKEGFRAALVGVPNNFSDELIDLPTGFEFVASARGSFDLVLVFVEGQADLRDEQGRGTHFTIHRGARGDETAKKIK
jgi:hypothetical protein